jgi:ABC-type bacteriocin/lantibiotic exporter with double-glycine peptidase domain
MSFDLNLINNSGFSSCTAKDYVDGTCLTLKQTNPNSEQNDVVFELKEVSYKYASTHNFTLRKLNLRVFDKEILLITGHIGSGKSTLIKLLTRLIYPSEGSIELQGTCIYDLPNKKYFQRVGFMPQNALLFKRSVLENIKYNNPKLKTNDINDVIKKYNLDLHFPNGLNVLSTTLSGGQKQLVWFLRIFFMKPDVIVMDEPTASIDEETKFVFIKLIKTMLNDKTIIIITHDQFLYQYGTRIVTMDDINNIV